MRTEIPLLQNVRVASPCSASWSGMTEVDGDRVRFCDSCRMNVYNLSAMGQAEAEGLLRRHEGRLCVRYFRRSDGTVLTKDCPVGKEAVRLMFLRRSVATAALFILGLGVMKAMQPAREMGGIGAAPAVTVPEPQPPQRPVMGNLPALATPTKPVEVMGDVAPVAVEPDKPREILGKVAVKPVVQEELGSRVGSITKSEEIQRKEIDE